MEEAAAEAEPVSDQEPAPSKAEDDVKEQSGASDNSDPSAAAGEEEEEGECAFCVYMRSGPCGSEFRQWEHCVEEADKLTDEVVVKCRDMTQALMKCMEGFTDYYGIVLQAGEKMSPQSSEESATESAAPAADSSSSGQRDESSSKQPSQDDQERKSDDALQVQILERQSVPA